MIVYSATVAIYQGSSHTTSIFLTEKEALEDLCADIKTYFIDRDMHFHTDPNNNIYVDFINKLNDGKYIDAVYIANEFADDEEKHCDWNARYYILASHSIIDTKPQEEIKPVVRFDASKYPNGMTCKKCNVPNVYAIPNQEDETFICCSCKTMTNFFGN